MGIYTSQHPREAPWWVYLSFNTHGRHPGGYYAPFTPMGGTLVGIIPFYTHGSTLVGILPVTHPWEAPWWVYSRYTPLGGTLVGMYLSVHSWEAPWWVYASRTP